jgi:para-aminobenzoate synthetase component 1
LASRELTLIEISPPPLESAFLALAGDEAPFWLDSGLVMPGLGRYCILGSRPWMTLESRGGISRVRDARGVTETPEDPFRTLRRLLGRTRGPTHPSLPFTGGAVGWLAYELGRFVERVPLARVDDIGLPDMVMAFHDTALIVDRVDGRAWIAAAENAAPGRAPAHRRAGELRERLASLSGADERPSPVPPPESLSCNFTREDYLRAVARCKEYIAAGDIFQVNLSRRFETRLDLPAADLFLRLRRINPAPMAAYLGFGDAAVVSASPERFLRVRDSRVETRPIKGTRPRGASPEEDRALAEELLRSEKDNAELAMIVDLERNDLGRVCSYGSVRVTEPRRLESFPTVHHLVATVEGRLHEGRDLADLLRATFPGGSITGAPKIRAMEIIAELEPTQRSVYTGAVGCIGFDGSMDLNIAIRTMLVRGQKMWFQAGGGIVADSDPAAEYEETWHKARAMVQAALQGEQTGAPPPDYSSGSLETAAPKC